MAVSQTQKNELYQFFAVAFDAAPGVTYMNQLMEAAGAGMTTKQIVNVFTTKTQFTNIYPLSMSNVDFGTSIIENVVGNTASTAAKAEAAAAVAAALNIGWSRGDAVYQIFTNLFAKSPSDPTWGQTKMMFDNQLVAAKYFTEVMLEGAQTNPDLGYLQKAISMVTPSSDVSTPAAVQAVISSATGYNWTLSINQDNLTGSIYGDTFQGTQGSLQLGDSINGGLGDDTLSLTVGGSGGLITGFATESVETIKVKSLSTGASTLDMSDVKGPVTLFSYETDGASLTFHDIQSINDTKIKIVDTKEDHVFQYDVGNAATPTDTANIAVQEMRAGSSITLENNNNPGQSFVDIINLASLVRADPGVQPSNTYKNDIDSLVAGNDLDTLNISGDADLLIAADLDKNISLVDAHTHTGAPDVNEEVQNIIGNFWELDLKLTKSNDGGTQFADDGIVKVTLKGSQGDNRIDFGSTNNDKVVELYRGNDSLEAGAGDASVNAGAGNDTVHTGARNDVVYAGEGNDVLTDDGSMADNVGVATTVNVYTAAFSQSGNYFDLGDGHDKLTVNNNSNDTVVAGTGNDSVSVAGNAVDQNNAVKGFQAVKSVFDLGAGNDVLKVGDAGISELLWAGDQTTDRVTISGFGGTFGDVSVSGGEGNDVINVYRDGCQSVDAGAGDDVVGIYQDGNLQTGSKEGYMAETANYTDTNKTPTGTAINSNHTVQLGAGNDSLVITGVSNIDGVTRIFGGVANANYSGNDSTVATGDDTVTITKDHRLLVDLGDGNDGLSLRAEDLQSDDTIRGGTGDDTMTLRNTTGAYNTGMVQDSETARTIGFETYKLVDSNITLHVTDHMIMTAEDNDLTVDTTGSFPTPVLYDELDGPYFNGMTYAQWVDAGASQGNENVAVEHTSFDANGLPTAPGMGLVYFTDLTEYAVQTVDITAITAPDYHFTLTGGAQRDIVVANEATINNQSTLNFDATNVQLNAWNKEDTLVVMDSAELRAGDLRNVDGLERIELVASKNVAQTWEVEINDRIIRQTTGTQELHIVVDPNVAAGSKLYVTFSENDVNHADTNVVITRNANVQVYVNGVLVTEPNYQDFSNAKFASLGTSGMGVYVTTNDGGVMRFTTNSDNLVGTTVGANLFIANSAAELNPSDRAVGTARLEDTVQLNFAVANQSENLANQLHNIGLVAIDKLVFNTENNVLMDGYQQAEGMFSGESNFAAGLDSIVTGAGDDRLLCMNVNNMYYTLGVGNDLVQVDNWLWSSGHGYYESNMYTTVNGGAGADSVLGSMSNDIMVLADVEYVQGDTVCESDNEKQRSCGNDNVTFTSHTTDVYVDLNQGEDSLQLDNLGAAYGKFTVYNTETILGGTAGDRIDAFIFNNSACGTGHMQIDGLGGNDTINATTDGYVGTTVRGGQGADVINIQETSHNGYSFVIADGDNRFAGAAERLANDGDDSITVGADGRGADLVWAYGGLGNDTMNISSDSRADVYGDMTGYAADLSWPPATETAQDGNDNIVVKVLGAGGMAGTVDGDAKVAGLGGNDTINVAVNDDASIIGGTGNDVITLTSDNDINNSGTGANSTGSYVFGEGGNDTITIHGDAVVSISGGAGNDLITLERFVTQTGNVESTAANPTNANGQDTLMFGNLNFKVDQVTPDAETNTQGQDVIWNFNFEKGPGGDLPQPGADDVMNFHEYFTQTAPTAANPLGTNGATQLGAPGALAGPSASTVLYADWTSGATALDATAAGVSILNVKTSFGEAQLRNNVHLGGTVGLELADGSKNVVILAKDSDPSDSLVGYDLFEVYYVQDVDTSAGSAVWQVNLVATVHAATAVGSVPGSVGINQFAW